MPAIDPGRLEREVEHIRTLLPDVGRVTRQASDLMERYADRTRRPGSTSRSQPRLTVPHPVVMTLARSLHAGTIGDVDAQGTLADSLWETEQTELRRTAAAMLSMRQDDGVPVLAERWARTCTNASVREELAGKGIQAWRDAQPEEALQQMKIWLEKPWTHVQAFTLLVLQELVAQPGFDNLPAIFHLLHPVSRFERREVRIALQALVEILIERSPPEAAFFIIDELASGHKRAVQLARKTLKAFPRDQQRLIRRALSA